MDRVYKIICFLLLISLASCGSDNKAKEKNCLEKAVSISQEDLEQAYLKGQDEAKSDIGNGVFAIKRWGMPPVEKYVNECVSR